LGILAVIQVPLVYFSVNLVRTLHQTQSIRLDGATMHPTMVTALLVNVAAFTMIYISLLSARMVIARAESESMTVRAVAGKAVISPPGLNDA
jgi:heme exporter protein C